LDGSDSVGKSRPAPATACALPSGVCGLTATSAALPERRQQLGLVLAEGEVAVRAPRAAVQHHDGGTGAEDGGQVDLRAVGIEKGGAGQSVAGGDRPRGDAALAEGPLLGGEHGRQVRPDLLGEAAVEVGDLRLDGRVGHGVSSCRRVGGLTVGR